MSQTYYLSLWTQTDHVADLSCDPHNDAWGLTYTGQWQTNPNAFGLSPALPLQTPKGGYRSATVRRFIENLLPEGRALDIAASSYSLSKSNIFGLIRVLGSETTGAFRFLPQGVDGTRQQNPKPWREVSLSELDQRINERDHRPFVEWDGKVRMSVAGYQDKLLVYIDGDPREGGKMYLPDYPLASTHILKPQPFEQNVPHMVVNEHFCMSLAKAMGFPVAEVFILRAPHPVLVVERFDRKVRNGPEGLLIERKHIIDVCQVCDLPVSFKYERNVGSAGDSAQYRDGVSFELLFAQLQYVNQKAVDKLTMLRWALFQLIIGNFDAHGKNYSFFVHPSGLASAPWYDLVSVAQYPQFTPALAMAFGDEFNIDGVKAYALADFAKHCDIDRRLLARESKRMLASVENHALKLVEKGPYRDDERGFVRHLVEYITAQAKRLQLVSVAAVQISDDLL